MCIRDRRHVVRLACGQDAHALVERKLAEAAAAHRARLEACLLYTSDAADERSSVDLGGRRIIKKKKRGKRERRKDYGAEIARVDD